MEKKNEFKDFIKENPELINKVKSGEKSWQDYYKLYNEHGNDRSVWDTYRNAKSNLNSSANLGIDSISKMIKNVNMDSIQKHIGTAQKALGFIKDMTAKDASSAASNIISAKKPLSARPLNKFFED